MFHALPVLTDPHYTEYDELQTVRAETCQMTECSSNGMWTSFHCTQLLAFNVSCIITS